MFKYSYNKIFWGPWKNNKCMWWLVTSFTLQLNKKPAENELKGYIGRTYTDCVICIYPTSPKKGILILGLCLCFLPDNTGHSSGQSLVNDLRHIFGAKQYVGTSFSWISSVIIHMTFTARVMCAQNWAPMITQKTVCRSSTSRGSPANKAIRNYLTSLV